MIWLVLMVVPVVYIVYNRWSWIHSYWEYRGVPGPRPLPFLGNVFHNVLGRKSLGELCLQWSRSFADTPLVGFYSFMTPFLLVNRSDYVETVMVEEFSKFTDRLAPRPGKTGPERFLTLSSGGTWQALRTKMAPIFSTEKLKGMLSRFNICCDSTLDIIDQKLGGDIAATEFLKAYVIEVSAKVVFGLESKDLSEFTRQCEKNTGSFGKRRLDKLIYFSFPRLADFLQISLVPLEQVGYFKKALQETFRRRKAAGAKINDVAQLLLELKEKGQVDVENWDEAEDKYLRPKPQNSSETLELTDELLTNQAMAFLTTGMETVFSALTFTLLELCQNQQAMDKLVLDIHRVLDQHKDFTYEALKDMKYLEMCILEAMRLHPGMPAVTRCCTRNYTFDNGLQVEKGMMLCVPVLAVHSDPQVYPEPTVFRPERFVTPPPPGTYIPFGDGPRMCIAKNFGMLEMKLVLAKLISKYEVKVGRRTKVPVATEPWSPLTRPLLPVFFNFTRRPPNNSH